MPSKLSLVPLVVCLVAGLASPAAAQSVSGAARNLADGWSLLAKGDAPGAARIAAAQLASDRNNVGALALSIDAALASGGAGAALSAYDQWLGSRRVDSPYVLRSIARTMLRDATVKQRNPAIRLEALQALAADGDQDAAATLEQESTAATAADARLLAEKGNEKAVRSLIASLPSLPGAAKAQTIEALGKSGSNQAVVPLKALLADPTEVNRAAAAEGLGRLHATDAISSLKPLLDDPMFIVKLKAAGALLRLSDASGLALLNDASKSEHATIRLAAAEELASQPDAWWQGVVRNLASDSDPSVRLGAARLIAPYDQPLASGILQGLMHDDNMGIRSAASDVFVERVAADFASLRQLLHENELMVRVRAAARILELTR